MSMGEEVMQTSHELSERAAQHRERFIALTKGKVEWLEVSDEKRPLALGVKVKYSPSPPPQAKALGVHPLGNIVIIDFDLKFKKLSPEEQMASLESVGFDFTDALKVRTPSGGMHVYIEWAKDAPLVGNIKLDKLGKKFTPPLELEGDVRGSLKTGHAVAPGSLLKGQLYTIEGEGSSFPLQASELCQLATAQRMGPPTENSTSAKEAQPSAPSVRFARATMPTEETVSPEVLRAAEKLSLKSGKFYWHERRAEVFAALRCCYTPQQVVFIWQQLGIGRDTHRNEMCSIFDLYRDYRRLSKKYPQLAPEVHGKCCRRTILQKKAQAKQRKDEWVATHGESQTVDMEKYLQRLTRSSKWRRDSVISLRLVSEALDSGRYRSKHYAKAMKVAEDILQPWANFGAVNILLGNDFLQDFYGWTPAEVRAVKGLLLARGVIYVSRPPSPGVTTAFGVPTTMKNHVMGKLLFALRAEHAVEVAAVDLRGGCIVEPATGEVLLTLKDSALERLLPKEGLPVREAGFAAQRLWQYLGGKTV